MFEGLLLNLDEQVSRDLDLLLPPANEVCEGFVFTAVCLSTGGGHTWQGGVMGIPGRQGACIAGEMATAVGSMHPTEMLSCSTI